MGKNNKLKAKIIMFSVLSAFCPGVFADDNTMPSSGIHNNAQSQTIHYQVTKASSLSDLIQPNAKINANFIRDLIQGRHLTECQKIFLGKIIGKGGFAQAATAYENNQESNNNPPFIIKFPVEEGDSYLENILQDEAQKIEQLAESANTFIKAYKGNNLYGLLLGLGAIVPVVGKTENGGIIQEYAGMDLKKSTHGGNRRVYDKQGFPWNLPEVLKALSAFGQALVALHTLEFIHRDIKAENVVWSPDGALKVIDLGSLTKFGNRLSDVGCSGNCPPESCSYFQFKKIIPQNKQARASYDIYCSSNVILTCLFGKRGYEQDKANFWEKTGGLSPKPSHYVEKMRDPNFLNDTDGSRSKFIGGIIDSLNEEMRENGEAHNAYPEPVLNEIKNIVIGILDPNPDNRPSAIEILEKLQDLALSDWNDTTRPEEERYRINRHPKLPEVPKENRFIKWDADWLKEDPFEMPTQQQRY
ncbi:MAG: protein kinase [Verrucomicrobiota bacterium]|nr:MAG: protein kinase [Verrucomicrobiota bacterium]